MFWVHLDIFFFFWRQKANKANARFLSSRGDFTAKNWTANLFLKIWVSLHHHPIVDGHLGPSSWHLRCYILSLPGIPHLNIRYLGIICFRFHVIQLLRLDFRAEAPTTNPFKRLYAMLIWRSMRRCKFFTCRKVEFKKHVSFTVVLFLNWIYCGVLQSKVDPNILRMSWVYWS